ncbi:DUF4386 family protein [Bacillus sp. DNRA2]|uniref:DUF4386 family protein n=1 Tax=Bacillus sp. DNRA2 TaxID=2723053 RepID=UPI00145C7A94|nr:DUF4386 family protein [Bacillus sp. DNRA2]NMD69364.1 DUF4386 family protein [Bacillus sp. DNRA2]
MSKSKKNQLNNVQTADSRWKGLLNAGGAAAITMFVLMVIQIIVFVIWPPPHTVEAYFSLFQNNWLLGLLSLDLLYIVDSTLLILIYLALYIVLKRFGESAMLIGVIFGITGVAAYFASNTAFEMLSLSTQYAEATSEAQRVMLLTTGQAMLETYKGTAFDIYYVLNTIVLFLFSPVMLRSKIFSKTIAYLGMLAGVLMIVPSTAGVLGLYFSLASLVPWSIWLILVARRLFQLGKGVFK